MLVSASNSACICIYVVKLVVCTCAIESLYFCLVLKLFHCMQALNRDLADKWQKWVDFPQEALDTIAEGSYYNIQITDKLRLISFNSDYGYVKETT